MRIQNLSFLSLLSCIELAFLALSPAHADALRDYSKFDHTIVITFFRAGNHDPSGQNQYFLRLSQFALVNTKDERLKPIENRKKSITNTIDFGQIELTSLSQWIPPETTTDGETSLPFYAAQVSGDSIRQATSNMMRTESIMEAEVAHMVTIELFERDKKYFVLNQDRLIASTHYFAIPPSSFDGSERVNQSIQISDNSGSLIRLNVIYDQPITPVNAAPAEKQDERRSSAR